MQQETRHSRPNGSESQLLGILEKVSPGEWDYTGDYGCVIGGKVPDFRHRSSKVVIELFSYYWHVVRARTSDDELNRLEHYRAYGYICIIIWEHELGNEPLIVDRIKNAMGVCVESF